MQVAVSTTPKTPSPQATPGASALAAGGAMGAGGVAANILSALGGAPATGAANDVVEGASPQDSFAALLAANDGAPAAGGPSAAGADPISVQPGVKGVAKTLTAAPAAPAQTLVASLTASVGPQAQATQTQTTLAQTQTVEAASTKPTADKATAKTDADDGDQAAEAAQPIGQQAPASVPTPADQALVLAANAVAAPIQQAQTTASGIREGAAPNSSLGQIVAATPEAAAATPVQAQIAGADVQAAAAAETDEADEPASPAPTVQAQAAAAPAAQTAAAPVQAAVVQAAAPKAARPQVSPVRPAVADGAPTDGPVETVAQDTATPSQTMADASAQPAGEAASTRGPQPLTVAEAGAEAQPLAPQPTLAQPRSTSATAPKGGPGQIKAAGAAASASASQSAPAASTSSAAQAHAQAQAAPEAAPVQLAADNDDPPVQAPADPAAGTSLAATPLAGPAASLATAPPAAGPETVARLATQIVQTAQGQASQFNLTLHPAELGGVQVKIQVDKNGQVRAALSFDNAQAAADLGAQADELRAQLSQAGFDVADGGLSFSLNGQGQQAAGDDGTQAGMMGGRAFRAAAAGAEDLLTQVNEAASRLARPGAAAGGLDIRI
jgi:flagellar hook-length control protein FliK